MKKFLGKNNKYYTWGDIKRAKYKLIYWVYFPQGLKIDRKDSVSYTGIMYAKNLKQAFKLAKKYNAPYFERLVQCKLGRWAVKEYIMNVEDYHISTNDIYDKYRDFPEICL